MANNIEYAKKFLPIIDELYKEAAVTEDLDAVTDVDFTSTNEVKILDVSTTGLGDYSRENGYPVGDVTAGWITLKLEEERGKEISVDRMDNEETLDLTFGAVTGSFVRLYVAPELDAYRFAKYAGADGILKATPAVLTKDALLAAIDEGVRAMDAAEIPQAGRKLYVSSDLKPLLNSALTRTFSSDNVVNTTLAGYNDMSIKYVPTGRFYTGVTLADGSGAWGFTPGAGAKKINFMIVHPGAVRQVKKFVLPKIFTPDENQKKDAWLFQFRLYHDAFVLKNKTKGVYMHASA